MEKLGVIGGMGAEATSYYYDQVVRHTAAACDQEHIDMGVLSKSTMPDRTLAIKTGDHERVCPGTRVAGLCAHCHSLQHVALLLRPDPVVYEGADYPYAA